MHEVALAQAVWRQVAAEMEKRPQARLIAVNLLVGRWSGADPESLEFALGLLARDSKRKGSRTLNDFMGPGPFSFRIRTEPLALACRACGRQFEPPELDLACPSCKSGDVEAVRGKDVYLESLEIE